MNHKLHPQDPYTEHNKRMMFACMPPPVFAGDRIGIGCKRVVFAHRDNPALVVKVARVAAINPGMLTGIFRKSRGSNRPALSATSTPQGCLSSIGKIPTNQEAGSCYVKWSQLPLAHWTEPTDPGWRSDSSAHWKTCSQRWRQKNLVRPPGTDQKLPLRSSLQRRSQWQFSTARQFCAPECAAYAYGDTMAATMNPREGEAMRSIAAHKSLSESRRRKCSILN